jgi:hypothetical protein
MVERRSRELESDSTALEPHSDDWNNVPPTRRTNSEEWELFGAQRETRLGAGVLGRHVVGTLFERVLKLYPPPRGHFIRQRGGDDWDHRRFADKANPGP